MKDIQYNGPEMSLRKVLILLVTAALIVALFLLRSGDTKNEPVVDVPQDSYTEQFVYISPFDSLFRLYADSVCDWKMLAAIAYVESKFDSSAHSYMGAQGLMQIMPATYRHVLARMGMDTLARSTELDIRVAVKYLDDLSSLFGFINEKERINYILGSYNGGSNHIFDAMRIARKNGVNRYNWNSLTPVLLSLSNPEVYNDSVCRHGRFDATETVQYVRRVNKKYNEYRSLELLFLASEKIASNNRE